MTYTARLVAITGWLLHAQADRDAVIESPSNRFEPMTAADYLTQRIQANFREGA